MMGKTAFGGVAMAWIVSLLLVVLVTCPAVGAALQAGVATADVTPGPNELSIHGREKCEGVHDPLSVRALALRQGDTTVVLAVADVIGLERPVVQALRARAAGPGLPAENIWVGATHCHSAPDSIGIWNGAPESWLTRFHNEIVNVIKQAVANLQPATAAAASYDLPADMIINWRDPDQLDPTGAVITFRDAHGKTIATLVNFACHAEVRNTHQPVITADFPGVLRTTIEGELGGTALYFNGALGGMVSPKVDDQKTTWADVGRFGRDFAKAALAALRQARPVEGDLAIKQRLVTMPLTNPRFIELGKAMGRPDLIAGRVETEIGELRLGPVQMVAIPGEYLPKPGLELKRLMTGAYKFQLGLTNDELGYLVPADSFRPTEYVERTSPGKGAAERLMAEYRQLLK